MYIIPGANSWRGDHYSTDVINAIREDCRRRWGYTCGTCGTHIKGTDHA